MHTEDFKILTADLRGLGGRRVWSLMISLFGDLAQDADQSIDGPLLSSIMARLQVKPEAARVALHRLRNDGWIVSEKSGRISQHSLSAKGRAESAAASPRIYAKPELDVTSWQLVLTEDVTPEQSKEMQRGGFTPLLPRVYVGSMEASAPSNTLCLSASDAPDWLRMQIEPQTHRKDFAELLQALSTLQSGLPEPGTLSPVETAVLRCLIVHNWRRLVLKQPALPKALVDPDGPSHKCHLQVARLLTALKRPKLSEIEQSCAAA